MESVDLSKESMWTQKMIRKDTLPRNDSNLLGGQQKRLCSNPSCSSQKNRPIAWTKRLYGLSNCSLCNLCFDAWEHECLSLWLPNAWCEVKGLCSQYRGGCTILEYTKLCSPRGWDDFFQPLIRDSSVLHEISDRVMTDADNGFFVTPPLQDMYKCMHTQPDRIKVIILGQDPYKNPGQANGIAFSVNYGIRVPPTLTNIHSEVGKCGFKVPLPAHGDLGNWVQQGVFLLNAALTTTIGTSGAHSDTWAPFTELLMNYVLKSAQQRNQVIVGVLWGKRAQNHSHLFQRYGHPYVQSAHPSPLSAHRGFSGSRPFSRVNEILRQYGKDPVDWSV